MGRHNIPDPRRQPGSRSSMLTTHSARIYETQCYVCKSAQAYFGESTHTSTHTRTYTHMFAHTHTHVRTHVCTHTYTRTHTLVHTHTYTHTCTYTRTHIQSYTHNPTHAYKDTYFFIRLLPCYTLQEAIFSTTAVGAHPLAAPLTVLPLYFL